MNKETEMWAATLIEAHRQPVVKVPINGPKYFSKINNYLGKLHFKLDTIKDMACEARAETRCGRSIGLWLPKQQCVKIISHCGGKINSMGFQELNTKFLYPFEAMFLLETNRMEIIDEDNTQWTIHKGYSILLRDDCEMELYKTFRKLVILGYEMRWRNIVEENCKRLKYCSSSNTNNFCGEGSYDKLFETLKVMGPKAYEESSHQEQSGWMFHSNVNGTWQSLQALADDALEIQSNFRKGKSNVLSLLQCDSALIEVQVVDIPDIPTKCIN